MMDCRLIQGFVSTIEAGGAKVRPAGCDTALTPVLPLQAFQVAVALFSDGSGIILGKL